MATKCHSNLDGWKLGKSRIRPSSGMCDLYHGHVTWGHSRKWRGIWELCCLGSFPINLNLLQKNPNPRNTNLSLSTHGQCHLYYQFSCSVVSDSLRPHESQHARPPCPSPTPRVHSDSHPSSQWYHPAISCSVVPFSSCPQSFPASESSNESALRMRWPKCWSFSFNISPFNEHPGLISFKLDWLGLLVVQGTLKSLLQHHSSKASFLRHSAFFKVTGV